MLRRRLFKSSCLCEEVILITGHCNRWTSPTSGFFLHDTFTFTVYLLQLADSRGGSRGQQNGVKECNDKPLLTPYLLKNASKLFNEHANKDTKLFSKKIKQYWNSRIAGSRRPRRPTFQILCWQAFGKWNKACVILQLFA